MSERARRSSAGGEADAAAAATATSSAPTGAAASALTSAAAFNGQYRYALLATRSESPAAGGALAACLASPSGSAWIIGTAVAGGPPPPNDAAAWDGGTSMTLKGTTYPVLVRNWVVLEEKVFGRADDGSVAELPLRGGRVVALARGGATTSDAGAWFDAQKPVLLLAVPGAAAPISMSLADYLRALDAGWVASRWARATAADSGSGPRLGAAPTAAQGDARTIDLSADEDLSIYELVELVRELQRGAQGTSAPPPPPPFPRQAVPLRAAAQAMAALSDSFLTFCNLARSGSHISDIAIRTLLSSHAWHRSAHPKTGAPAHMPTLYTIHGRPPLNC